MEYKLDKNIDDLFSEEKREIETENYILRMLKKDDWEDMIEIYQNKYLHMYNRIQYIYSEKMAINLLTKIYYDFTVRKAVTWMIERKEDNENLGIISLSNISSSDRKTEVGYALKETEMRKGIMSEVLDKLIEVLLDIGFVRIEANINVENIASIKLCKKIKFINEGLRRKYLFNPDTNEYFDSYIFAVVSKDEDTN
ncbi:MAG: GNAT family N-acetyltransferase [Sarcina sp.]